MEKNQQTRNGRKPEPRKASSNNKPRRRYDVSTNLWEIEPRMARVVHGVPDQVDRIKSLGNSVIPKQAEIAFEILIGIAVTRDT